MSRSLRVRIRRWHRSLGAIVGLGAIWLIATGITLNHAPDLGLDEPGVEANWVLNAYNIHFSPPINGWKINEDWIVSFAGKLYFNTELVTDFAEIIGVAGINGLIIAAAESSLILLDPNGQVIETLDESALPGHIQAAATKGDDLCLQTKTGWHCSDNQMLSWTLSQAPAHALSLQELPANVSTPIQHTTAAQQLSWERVLVDLHSGRFFGSWGRYIIDMIAIGIGLLALSGLWLWLRTQPHTAKKP
ncbi:MAG: PepSY domain-containing protein [Oceanococcus sp.]